MIQMPQLISQKRTQNGLFARIFRSAQTPALGGALRIAPGVRVSLHAEGHAEGHEEGLTLFDTHTGQVFTCDRVGARIWTSLALGRSIDSIAGEISIAYGVERERALRDAEAFVGALSTHGLVTRRVR